jgi:hypothetical protein
LTNHDSAPAERSSEVFLQEEIDRNRAGEWMLLPKAALALAFVGVLIALHQIFFA